MNPVVIAFAIAMAGQPIYSQQPAQGELQSDDVALMRLRDSIVAQWALRLAECSTIRVIAEGTTLVPKGAYDNAPAQRNASEESVPASDYTHPERVDILLDVPRNRFLINVESRRFHSNSATFKPVHDIWAFNGDELRRQMPGVTDNRGTHYSVVQPDFRYHTLDYSAVTLTHQPVFLACGVIMGDSRPKAIASTYEEGAEFAVQGIAVHEGRECLVLRTPTKGYFFEYWADIARDGIVVRALFCDPEPSETINIHYAESPNGWQLSGWNYTQIDPVTSRPIKLRELAVRSIVQGNELRIGDVDFTPDPTEGMIVANDHDNRRYVVGQDGTELPLSTVLNKGTIKLQRILALLVICVVFGLGMLWYFRIRRRAAS